MREFNEVSEISEISAYLALQPSWDTLSAYARTKLVCAELLRAGASIPAWTTLRELIGKGSANDINRAKKDFRQEHAASLRKLEGFACEGVPDGLSPHIVGLWQAALAHAQRSYADKEQAWQDELVQAAAAREQAQSELQHSQAAALALQVRADEYEQSCHALQTQLQTEQAARMQAEKTNHDLRAELSAQRDRLDQALAQAQSELEKAINRLEASERRAMMEIERTRQDAAQQLTQIKQESEQKIAQVNTLLKTEQEQHEGERLRLSEQLQHERALVARHQAQSVAHMQENRTLTERTKLAETHSETLRALNAALQTQHAKLVAQHGKLLGAIEQPARRGAALLQGGLKRAAKRVRAGERPGRDRVRQRLD